MGAQELHSKTVAVLLPLNIHNHNMSLTLDSYSGVTFMLITRQTLQKD